MASAAPILEPQPAKPFLKWVGGKRQLMRALMSRVPDSYGRYFEPFLGGGALFFSLRPPSAVLADNNERLIRAYRGVKNDVEEVIDRLKRYRNEKDFYYRTRRRDIDSSKSDPDVAAWLIYLNKTGYNGLYRVNSQNGFNVPFGRYKKDHEFYDPEALRRCSEALVSAQIRHGDFEKATANARKGDFVYFDPPYVPLSATSSFASYTSGGFGPKEQQRLRDVALKLKKKGVHVLLSNSSAKLVRDLYGTGFQIAEVQATRVVNSKANRRGSVTEVLID